MDVVYLFDAQENVRRVLEAGVSELIHAEQDYMLTAEIPIDAQAMPGEYIGFECVDGRFRMFAIDTAEDDDAQGVTSLACTDAAVAEITGVVVENVKLTKATGSEAVTRLLSGTNWELGTVTAKGDAADVSAYYVTLWDALADVSTNSAVRIVPYYVFEGGKIAARRVDVLDRTPVFRGRLYDSENGASNIVLTRDGNPFNVAYGVGKALGTGDDKTRLTFANAVWRIADGDPVDKPKGQTWVADTAALKAFKRREMVVTEQDIDGAEELLKATWEALQESVKPKVSGTATVEDLEMAQGHEHKAVRLWDTVAVQMRTGEVFETQVIGISRDYLRPWLTKIKIGEESFEEPDTTRALASINSNLSSISGAVGRAGNGVAENSSFIVENQEQIRLHTINLEKDGQAIQQAQIDIGNAQVNIEALVTETSNIGSRVSAAELNINANKAEIELKASVETVNAQGERLTQAESSIKVNHDAIELKVSKDGVISSINQTSEQITINANKINLSGYVTADNLKSELTQITNGYAVSLQTANLRVTTNANVKTLSINGAATYLDSRNFVTGVKLPIPHFTTLEYKDHDGINRSRLVCNGFLEAGEVTKSGYKTFVMIN